MVPLPAGWEASERTNRVLGAQVSAHLEVDVSARTAEAVLARARRLLGHARRPVHCVEDTFPASGELDLEATTDRDPPWSANRLQVRRTEPRDAEVVLILDTSLSMTGEKIALVAVAAAILQLALGDVAVVSFDTAAHVRVPVGRPVPTHEGVRRVLGVPAQGYTNLEAGLARAADELARSRRRERVAFLFTDGLPNVGWDPLRPAGRFPRLHVIQVGPEHAQGTRTCRRLASAGRGRRFRARNWEDLPAVARDAVRFLFRT
ncbi:MAG: VWA domain-containing protein [Deltaproteobacteria bacterium]|nr:VWA domain-containing protein [Deltaproteobacteria bacterium]